MRKLSTNDLCDGMLVQTPKINSYLPMLTVDDFTNDIFQIFIESDKIYYSRVGSNWRSESTFYDNWYETPQTIKLNRDIRLNTILNYEEIKE